jgi:hypothetical protein
MSALPPGPPEAPQPGQQAAPPPGWQPQPAWPQQPQAQWQPYAYPPPAPRRSFDRGRWLPTVAVAAVIAATVLGGIGLDKAVAAPSAGTLAIGANATITAAPGWTQIQTDQGVGLQKAEVKLFVAADVYGGSASDLLAEVVNGLKKDVDQITFGTEKDGRLAGHDAAMIGFEAINSGSSGSTVDGEAICMIAGPDGIVMEAVAPMGYLDTAADDIKFMASSVEVGQ